jgi:4-diphosphocytidyl-2-C-methyl-D-erythritol kinase
VVIEEQACAKVNLTLQVLGRRADGYHALASVVAFASVGDVVTLDTAKPSGVTVSGPFAPQLPSEVLIARTLELLRSSAPDLVLGAVHLDKQLPVAAGIGGGSADAAAVLRAVRRANPQAVATVDWHGLAAMLGADVPVCLANTLTYLTGTGDVLQPLPALARPIAAVLANPCVAVPADKTAQVFRGLNAAPIASAIPPPAPALSSLDDVVAAVHRIGNDLEAPAQAVVPAVAQVLTALDGLPGCRAARMSGAGPTCFAIVDDPHAATAALRAAHPGWWIEPVTLS